MNISETKRGRGRPLGTLKDDARRITTKLRWTEGEIESVKAASFEASESVSRFIRTAAIARSNRRTK